MALLSQCTLKYGVTAIRDAFYRGVSVFGFNPASLFASGEQGAWYDPSDFATMFQDAAGTTPVTAVGQPVGKINDKSGRGNHATQATAAARPVLRQDGNGKYYLEYDGVDDNLSTAAIDFTATDKMSVFAGITNNRNSQIQGFITLGSSTTEGNFLNWLPGSAGQNHYEMGQFSGTNSYARWTAPAPPYTKVITEQLDLAQPGIGNRYKWRENGSQLAQIAGYTAGTAGVFKNDTLSLGQVGGGSPYSGRIYSLILRGALSTTQEITDTEKWVAGKTGVTLP